MRERSHKALAGLVHLRAVAITMVFVFHYCLFDHPLWLERVGGFGWTGVDLFFVLSGFLIARQLFVQKPSLRRFYWRRLLRIVPAYLVMLAAYELLPSIRERGELPSLWRMLTFSQNVGLDLATRGTFSHAWSLCIEEQFYLMFPLVLLALGRRRALVPFLILVGMTMRAWSWTHVRGNTLAWYEWVYYPTWGRLDGLLAGITLAAVRWRNRHAAPVGLALLVGAAFVDAESRAGSIVIFPLLALGYGAIVLAALDPASILSRVPARVSSGLARLSYALYLVHKAAIHVTQRALAAYVSPSSTAMFGLCVATSLAAALLLHFSVERPFLRWRDRDRPTRTLSPVTRSPPA